MAASSILGKRREREDEPAAATADCTMIEVRVVLENYWATESVQIPASAATTTTVVKLFKAVQEALPVAARPTLAAHKLAAPKFLLQETSVKNQWLRQTQFFPVRYNNNVSYSIWYERNVLQMPASVLKCEVHLRTFACTMREARDSFQSGHQPWLEEYYLPSEPSTRPQGGHVWEVSAVDEDEVDWEALQVIVDAPSTRQWFPMRAIEEEEVKEEVKEKVAVAKKAKKAKKEVKEVVDAPVKEEKGSGEGVEETEEEKAFWDDIFAD